MAKQTATIHMVKDDEKFMCGRRKGEFTSDASLVTCEKCKSITTTQSVNELEVVSDAYTSDQPLITEVHDIPVALTLEKALEELAESTPCPYKEAVENASAPVVVLTTEEHKDQLKKDLPKKEGTNGLRTHKSSLTSAQDSDLIRESEKLAVHKPLVPPLKAKSNVHQMEKRSPKPQEPTPAIKKRAEELASKNKDLPLCKCGCKEKTKGGTFKPGHDARFHSAQKKLQSKKG